MFAAGAKKYLVYCIKVTTFKTINNTKKNTKTRAAYETRKQQRIQEF